MFADGSCELVFQELPEMHPMKNMMSVMHSTDIKSMTYKRSRLVSTRTSSLEDCEASHSQERRGTDVLGSRNLTNKRTMLLLQDIEVR